MEGVKKKEDREGDFSLHDPPMSLTPRKRLLADISCFAMIQSFLSPCIKPFSAVLWISPAMTFFSWI